MMRRFWALALLIMLGVTIAGCGAERSSQSQVAADVAQSKAAGAPSMPKEESMGNGTQDAKLFPSDTYMQTSSQGPQQMDRRVIMNAELHLKVKDMKKALDVIAQAVKSGGGYVQETRQYGTKQQGLNVEISLRVPSGKYTDAVNLMVGMAEEVIDRREWTTDVTTEYLDLEARITTKEIHLTQLQKLYAKGGTIKEMMELEQEIARITADLESLKGRFRFLSNQVEFSTITAKLYEPGAPIPVKSPKSVLERMKLGFIESWNSMANFTGDLVVGLVSMIPRAIYLLIFGGLGYLVLRVPIRKWRRSSPE